MKIEFEIDAIDAAEHWHGGQSSMFYALSSTGALSTGTMRPNSYDEDRPMTDSEWISYLADKLEDEAEDAIKDCRKMLRSCEPSERDDYDADLDGLQSILDTIKEWRSKR